MKSYQLTPEQQAYVDAAIAKGKEKYAPIADIVMESPLAPELAEQFEDRTEEDVRIYLRQHMPEEEYIDHFMTCHLSAWGGMTAREFGERYGWSAVMGTARRMYG